MAVAERHSIAFDYPAPLPQLILVTQFLFSLRNSVYDFTLIPAPQYKGQKDEHIAQAKKSEPFFPPHCSDRFRNSHMGAIRVLPGAMRRLRVRGCRCSFQKLSREMARKVES